MNVPQSNRKKALLIVDVQDAFLDERNRYVVGAIVELLKTTHYDAYVVATFHAGEGSIWDKQQHWRSARGVTVPEVVAELSRLDCIAVEKETRSVFKGDKDIATLLRQSGIEEVHVVGFETDDCVLATCFESFDLGFFTYAIEGCCESTDADRHEHGLALLRAQNMTNNSII